jgi:hypothetical protein
MYISTNPIYPNKCAFFTTPILEDPLRFNWFICGKPYISESNKNMVAIGSHSLFFDNETGKTYRKKESKHTIECLVLIEKRYSDKSIDKAIKKGYSGIAVQNYDNNESTFMKLPCPGNVCSEIELIFHKDSIEESDKCPYILFSKSRLKFLQSQIPNFPSDESIKKYVPGTDSLYLKMLLSNYFNQT